MAGDDDKKVLGETARRRDGSFPPAPMPPGAYQRARDLPRLIPMWPAEIADNSIAGRQRLVAKMARALREERRRAKSGYWAYDLARHAALLRAYQAETAALSALMPRAPVTRVLAAPRQD